MISTSWADDRLWTKKITWMSYSRVVTTA